MSDKRPQAHERFLFVGKTHSGKSHALKARLSRWQQLGARVIAVDVCDEYSRARGGPLAQRVSSVELAEAPSKVLEPRLSLAVVPADDSPRGWARTLLLVAKLARAAGKPVVMVVEEVGSVVNSSSDPQCHRARMELISLAVNGRHRGISLALATQRAAQVPTDVRAQLSEIVIFAQDLPEDLAALAERVGKETAEKAAALALGQSVIWRGNTTTTTTTEKEASPC